MHAMDYFRPHEPCPTFEGYYCKFDLPSRGHIALIICSVPKSEHKPHMVSFTYVPPEFPQVPVFQREIWVDSIEMTNIDSTSILELEISSPADRLVDTIRITASDIGEMTVKQDSTTIYSIHDLKDQFMFTATIGGESRTPWSRNNPDSTPEGLLVHLPLPLHWHVHSLASDCTFSLNVSEDVYPHVHPADRASHPLPAKVHQEKNWAYSFPTSHIWIQCRNPETNSGFNVAGGSIIGMEAYLLTYHARDPKNDISFTPPYAMTPAFLPKISPTMTVSHSWLNRSVDLTVSSLTRKIEIRAQAPPGTFVGLSAPFNDGHRDNFLSQSFRAKVNIKVFEAGHWGFGHWQLVCEEDFENASLEFGGDAYEEKNKGRYKDENGGQAWIS